MLRSRRRAKISRDELKDCAEFVVYAIALRQSLARFERDPRA